MVIDILKIRECDIVIMRVLVLGIGNILFGDEGVGVHLCNYLKLNFDFTSKDNSVEFVDGGTLANMLIPLIADYDEVLLLDCVSVGGANVGDVYSFDFDNIPQSITWTGSAHEVEMLQTLNLMRLMGDLPHVHVIGIIPEVIGEDTAFTLSDSLLNGSTTMIDSALLHLENLGFSITRKDNKALQEIANLSYRGF